MVWETKPKNNSGEEIRNLNVAFLLHLHADMKPDAIENYYTVKQQMWQLEKKVDSVFPNVC